MNATSRKLFLGLFLTVAVSAPLAAQVKGVTLPAYRQVKLPNGALLLLMEKRDVPLIALNARIRGGALADPAGKEGTASVLAELLKKGAGKRNSQQLAEAIDSVGGVLDATSSREALIVNGEFMSRDQDLMIELLSDMLRRPTFPAEEFVKVRDRAIESIAAAKDADPRSLIGTYYHAFLFNEHLYGRPINGDEASLSTITRDDVTAYFKNHVGGDRLVLAVVGDFRTDDMAAKLRRAFGDWGKAAATAPKATARQKLTGRRVLLVDKPDATQTYFWIGNVGIARVDPDRVSFDLVNTMFGGRFTSLLNTELRVKSGLSYGASSTASRPAEPGALAIASYTQTKTTAEAVDMALTVLKGYRETGMDAENLASVKSYVLGQYPLGLETGTQLAARLSEIAFYGLDRKDVDEYAARVTSATEAELKKLIPRVYPAPDDLTFVFIGNAAEIREVVKKYGPVTEMKISDRKFVPVRG